MKTKVLVTGSNGQLGQCLQSLALQTDFEFSFFNSTTLDISSKENINTIFNSTYDFCINCAAYTAVDKAEEEKEKANLINNIAVRNIAESCKTNNITLIHISTDFVFNGNKTEPYHENDETKPISVYGQTKLDGEKAIQDTLKQHFIIRTSWLYSQFGNNFLKSMLNLAKTRSTLSIVSDQVGTPTYAMDLAKTIIVLIKQNKNHGTYHYSNNGVASWFDFANEIFRRTKTTIELNSIPTSQYPTAANRPHYSVLNKTKLKQNFNVIIPEWEESLETCLKALF
ncbi:dTDP-4-dehydrorhamnose reductase [Lacinutrix mariniflava]|uniref:dTDP-4-dehydrorhamnose reductase n=1 Tax=Lacinutrix mariniflava TaxID=342955 RepID=UPI0006E39E11|nr:dTDP-4-dehydrorhamnose reductase [Lacinutrix mariniflava]